MQEEDGRVAPVEEKNVHLKMRLQNSLFYIRIKRGLKKCEFFIIIVSPQIGSYDIESRR